VLYLAIVAGFALAFLDGVAQAVWRANRNTF